jgi:hypothetical protein
MKLRWRTVGEQALAARRPRPVELLAAIDEVNPTPRERLDPAEREERYAMKGRLQTRLIERFPADLELRRDADGLLLLALRGVATPNTSSATSSGRARRTGWARSSRASTQLGCRTPSCHGTRSRSADCA